jgi:hypothetical protein
MLSISNKPERPFSGGVSKMPAHNAERVAIFWSHHAQQNRGGPRQEQAIILTFESAKKRRNWLTFSMLQSATPQPVRVLEIGITIRNGKGISIER